MRFLSTAVSITALLPSVMGDWFLRNVRCEDNDCPIKLFKNKFSFDYDNGRGILTHCTISAASPFTIPNGWVNCDNPVVKVRFSRGAAWDGCSGFKLMVALQDGHVNQGKEIFVGESVQGYECRTHRSPCGTGACFNCGGNACDGKPGFTIQTVPDENPGFNPH